MVKRYGASDHSAHECRKKQGSQAVRIKKMLLVQSIQPKEVVSFKKILLLHSMYLSLASTTHLVGVVLVVTWSVCQSTPYSRRHWRHGCTYAGGSSSSERNR